MNEHELNIITDLFKKTAAGNLTIMESKYHFQLGPSMSNSLQNVPAETCLYITINESGQINANALSGPCSGWRVKAGQFYLYLSIDQDRVNDPFLQGQVGNIHNELMARAVYYPREDDILNYWSRPDDDVNRSEDYVHPVARSIYLENLIKKHCKDVSSVLELGCNIGRNLNHLNRELNVKVSGIEISKYALDLMQKTYPSLRDCTFYNGDMTSVIESIPDKTYDLVFSMAVLMHIYPSTPDQFWSHIVRISSRYIITIENESSGSNRNWPRNYKQFLERLGPREIHSETVGQVPGLENYTTRIFSLLP